MDYQLATVEDNMKRQLALLSVSAILLAAMTGCAVALVGGAAAGGYYVGKDQRPVGEMSSDARITAAINVKFTRDELVSNLDIDVDTYEGIVTLWGNLPTEEAIQRAVELAQSVKGVKEVISKLKVIPYD